MKKFLLSLAAVAACAMSMSAETLTIADGTTTNNRVPISGYNWDVSTSKTQTIFPAEMLTDMQGNSITSVKFYTNTAGVAFKNGRAQVMMGTTELTEFATTDAYFTDLKVVNANFTAPETGVTEFEIVFDEPFEYTGGNLVFACHVAEGGTYGTTYYYGETSDVYSALSDGARHMFIPKTTFTYEPTVKLDYDARVTPAALDFGKLNPGESQTLNVTLTNRGLNAFTPTLTAEAPFSVNAAAELAPDASVVIPVTFAPTALGNYTGTLSIAYGGESPLTVALTGVCSDEKEMVVCEGTRTSSYVPVYGYNYDAEGAKVQMIYPADMLADLEGANIVGVKFHSGYTMHLTGGSIQLSVGSTETTAFTENETGVENPVTGLTAVASTTPVDGSKTLEFTFDQPYKYEGGNLAVETIVTEAGGYNSESFLGVVTDYFASYYEYVGYGSGNAGVKFLPMMTIVYTMPQAEPETYTVEGYVMDSEGEALEGVNVVLTVTAAEAQGAPRMAAEPVTYTATTDATGAFAIEMTPVEGAAYSLAFSKDGYKDQTIEYNLDDEVRVYMEPDATVGVDTIEAAQAGKVTYVNPMGQMSDRPFQGVNIVVRDGKTVGKVVR